MKSEAVIRGSASGLVLHCFPLHPVQGVKKRYIFMASCLMHHLDVSAHAASNLLEVQR